MLTQPRLIVARADWVLPLTRSRRPAEGEQRPDPQAFHDVGVQYRVVRPLAHLDRGYEPRSLPRAVRRLVSERGSDSLWSLPTSIPTAAVRTPRRSLPPRYPCPLRSAFLNAIFEGRVDLDDETEGAFFDQADRHQVDYYRWEALELAWVQLSRVLVWVLGTVSGFGSKVRSATLGSRASGSRVASCLLGFDASATGLGISSCPATLGSRILRLRW